MKIYELLRQYRLEQGKTQKEWASNVISPSYYSKVEKNIHRISAEDLIALLEANNVSPIDFFSKLNSKAQLRHKQQATFERLAGDAYYQNSKAQLLRLKHLITENDIFANNDLIITIDAYIALLNDDVDSLDKKTKEAIKEKIFNTTKFDRSKLAMYCSFMPFYDIDSNLLLCQRIMQQYQNSADTKIQSIILAIIANLLSLCIEQKRYEVTKPFIKIAVEVESKPELFFYKNMLLIFINIIAYHDENSPKYLAKCKKGIENLALLGMPEYGKKVEKFFYENIKVDYD